MAKKEAEMKFVAAGKRIFVNEELAKVFEARLLQAIKEKHLNDPNFLNIVAR